MTWTIIVLVVLALVLWSFYISWRASRLDRLHNRVEAARTALDLALVRRASAASDLAFSGLLDPATSVLLADAVRRARLAEPADRDLAESDLTRALRVTVGDPDLRAELQAADARPALGANGNAAPLAPDAPVIPGADGIPDAPVIPGADDVPGAAAIPDGVEIPGAVGVPDATLVADVAGIPDLTDSQDMVGIPNAADAEGVADAWGTLASAPGGAADTAGSRANGDARPDAAGQLDGGLDPDDPSELLDEVERAAQQVYIARKFYNDVAGRTIYARSRPLARVLRLSGSARQPEFFEMEDALTDGDG